MVFKVRTFGLVAAFDLAVRLYDTDDCKHAKACCSEMPDWTEALEIAVAMKGCVNHHSHDSHDVDLQPG